MMPKAKHSEIKAIRENLLKKQKGVDPITCLPIKDPVLDHCFDEETEVLTEAGFMPFREANDLSLQVAQWCNFDISFTYPLAYIEREYCGELVRLRKTGLDIACTPEHELISVNKTSGGTMRFKACEIPTGEGHIARSLVIPKHGVHRSGEGVNLSDNEIRLYVAFQADGCFSTGARFRFKKQHKINRIQSLLSSCGIPYTEHQTDCFQAYISPRCTPWFFQKVFSVPVHRFTEHQLQVFVDEIQHWDGSKNGNSVQYSSTIKENVEYVRMATVLAGYRGTQWERKRVESEQRKTLYYLNFSKPKSSDSNRGIQTFVEHYSGTVYCFRVPSKNIIIRRRGCVAVVGNCHQNGHIRAVLQREINAFEGKVINAYNRYVKHLGVSIDDTLINLLEYWQTDFSDNPIHPKHLTEDDKLIRMYKRRIKNAKRKATKDKYRALIKEIHDKRQ